MPTNMKPWNVVMTSVEPDERLYIDFKEADKTLRQVWNLKLPRKE